MLWIGVARQFWPKVKYGLACNLAPMDALENFLQPEYNRLAPLGGICSKAKREIHMLAAGFYGAGFPHPVVETLVEQ